MEPPSSGSFGIVSFLSVHKDFCGFRSAHVCSIRHAGRKKNVERSKKTIAQYAKGMIEAMTTRSLRRKNRRRLCLRARHPSFLQRRSVSCLLLPNLDPLSHGLTGLPCRGKNTASWRRCSTKSHKCRRTLPSLTPLSKVTAMSAMLCSA